MGSTGVEFAGPVGMRDQNGDVIPFPKSQGADTKKPPDVNGLDDSHYVGVQENVPSHVGQLVSTPCRTTSHWLTKTRPRRFLIQRISLKLNQLTLRT